MEALSKFHRLVPTILASHYLVARLLITRQIISIAMLGQIRLVPLPCKMILGRGAQDLDTQSQSRISQGQQLQFPVHHHK